MSQQNTNRNEDYEKAILWVPDPTSPAGWIRRKVWAASEEESPTSPRRRKPQMGFPMPWTPEE